MAKDVVAPRRGGGVQKRKVNKRVRWTPQVEARFLAALAETCNIAASARAVGVRPSIPYQHRMTSPAFRAAYDAAIAQGYETLQAAAIERGIKGVRKPVFYQGKRVGSMVEYSDQLVLQLLRMHQDAAIRIATATSPAGDGRSAVAELEAKLTEMNLRLGGEG